MIKIVYHSYDIDTVQMSAYQKAKAILEAIEPLKNTHSYGWTEQPDYIKIWWNSRENLGG